MRIFCTDKKLNISSKYLSPGEPYSGPCLKKDTLALSNLLSESIKDISLINQIDISNETQIDLIINKIESMQDENIGFYGLEFKKGSGDIRNSYMIKLIKRVKNKNIFIFDESVSQRELKNVLGSEFKIEKSLQEMADKVDLVFTKFDTSLKINKKVISLSSL
jgi:GDP-mannose 6-dehydrogenase